MIWALIFVPIGAGLLAFALPTERPQRSLLLAAAGAHMALVIAAWVHMPGPVASGWFQADSIGLLFFGITSTLFLIASVYAVGYLQREVRSPRPDWVEGHLFSNAPERVFVGCLLLFLGAMTTVTLSHHLGALWVAVEATTLASAPLIYFHRHHRSLEATWKYLVVGSVGIALALLGTFFLGVATSGSGGSFILEDLVKVGPALHVEWLKAAFILFLVGYGTKMGLAPFHTWLPDAHSESPSLVSALMSGALLNTAFVAILRSYQVLAAAGQAHFAQELLIAFGLVSMAVAAVFMIRQGDYKRMLAYSSVEHMGILALGVGVGGAATYGALFHAVNHSIAKALLFLVAGNLLAYYRTTSTRGVRGVLRSLPASGWLWLVGFLAITGAPPFGAFSSEFTVLQGMISQHHRLVAGIYLALLALVFMGMATVFMKMAQGEPWHHARPQQGEPWLVVAPPLTLACCAVAIGLYLPPAINHTLSHAAVLLGGHSP